MINNHIFYPFSHLFPVNERKSRINSFSISNRLIYLSLLASSYCIWVSLPNLVLMAVLPLEFIGIPANNFFDLHGISQKNFLLLFVQVLIVHLFPDISVLLILIAVFHSRFIMSIFSEHNKTSYGSLFHYTIGDLFCHCPFLLDLFIFWYYLFIFVYLSKQPFLFKFSPTSSAVTIFTAESFIANHISPSLTYKI